MALQMSALILLSYRYKRDRSPERSSSVEVYILNFNEEIYGEEIQVNFKRRIRDEIRFDSPSQLIEQIEKDIRWAKENVFGKVGIV